MSHPTATPPPVLPNRGTAKVKSVLSGDTVVLLGRSAEGKRPPEVTFTFERVTAPRCVRECFSGVLIATDNIMVQISFIRCILLSTDLYVLTFADSN